MNHFVSGYTGFSPYEMMYIRKAPSLTELEECLDHEPSNRVPPGEFMETMKKHFKFVKKIVMAEALRQQQIQKYGQSDSTRTAVELQTGDLVMIHRPQRGALRTTRKMVSCPWIGPARITSSLGSSKFLVSNLLGSILLVLVHQKELKLYQVRHLDKDRTVLQAVTGVDELLDQLQKEQTKQQ